MKPIIWGSLLTITLLASPADPQSCRPPLGGVGPRNLALGKPAYQSSIYPNEYGGPPEKAVDGNCNGLWTHASCTHTNLERNPWWMVDLGESRLIQRVVVKNREDCCDRRLSGAEVRLGDSLENNGRVNHLCGRIQDTSLGSISIIHCNNNRGRYISIHLPREEYLTVCEVEVYGSKMKCIVWESLLARTRLAGPEAVHRALPPGVDPRNLALGKPTYQSSIYPNEYGGPPEKAVDGDCSGLWTDGSCTHTNLERNPWWMVDLGESHKIHVVVVKNREDCCDKRLSGAEVRLGDSRQNNGRVNHLCGTIQDTSLGSIRIIHCNNNRGRYVSVHLPREDYLTVCEVEVYSIK